MAYERTSDSKIRGDSLDAFVENLSKTYARQLTIRNANDETKFNQSVLEQNLSLEGQLEYRKEQLKRVADDPTERRRVRDEISNLKDRIEQKQFADAYLEKLIGYESGLSSIDSVISWLTDQKSVATDESIKDAINKQLIEKQSQKYDITKNLITNQTEYALNDKSDSIISNQIEKVTSAKNKALFSGDDYLVSMFDLQIQALNKASTENSIDKDMKNFAVSSITGYATATKLLDAYNAKISSSTDVGPVTVGGVTYSSAMEFWTYKRDSYVADNSSSGFFSRIGDETVNKIKVANSKNSLTTNLLASYTNEYSSLAGRPELAGYEMMIDITKQNALQTGADLISDQVVNKYAVDYDLNKAVSDINSLKGLGVNVTPAYTKLITSGAAIKQGQVNSILSAAQTALENDPTLTPEKAIQLAIASGASLVRSPEELAGQTEEETVLDFTDIAGGEKGQVDERLTVEGQPKPATTPTTQPKQSIPTPVAGGSIVDYLNSRNLASDFSSRARLASQYGITNYTGSAQQNTQLLGILQTKPATTTTPTTTITPKPVQPQAAAPQPAPVVKTPPPAQPKTTYQGTSVVDYLGSVGQDTSFTARTKLAKEKGIVNYTGSAEQNLQLLKTLRGF